jgi:ubiquinone/menaquinone biosynthesis C-methylase UbiE
VSLSDHLAADYTSSARAWANGPARVYARVADVVVGRLGHLRSARALDLGCGTGAATWALMRAGADVTAIDIAPGMLAVDAGVRPSCVVGDAAALPFSAGCFDVVVAAFSINHLPRPADGFREARRVTRPGGCAIVTAYAADDGHPVKHAVTTALRELGWTTPPWMDALRRDAMPLLSTVASALAELACADLRGRVEHVRIEIPESTRPELIEWRLGMPDVAPFIGGLSADDRVRLRWRAGELLGDDPPPLTRSVIIVTIDA